jgi:hypothetical protein
MEVLKITQKMSGKMTGFSSLNTSTLANQFCQAMIKAKKTVCAPCYAARAEKRYKTAQIAFEKNGEILSQSILDPYVLPQINAVAFRFSAYGELINMNHMVNLMNIAKKNHRTTFTLWTKRHDIVFKYLRDFEKPKNCIFIYSSSTLNKIAPLRAGFDKVFTVYDKKYAQENNIDINCGSKKCIDCMTCYTPGNKTIFIKELKK